MAGLPPLLAPPRGNHTLGLRLGRRICLSSSIPKSFNGQFRMPAGVSLPRLSIAAATSDGMLTVSSIACPARVRLRARLTLIRLALIRKPWSYGEGGLHPLYRYLYLHLLFRLLQYASRQTFNAKRNAPLPITQYKQCDSTSSAPNLCPIIIHAGSLDR